MMTMDDSEAREFYGTDCDLLPIAFLKRCMRKNVNLAELTEHSVRQLLVVSQCDIYSALLNMKSWFEVLGWLDRRFFYDRLAVYKQFDKVLGILFRGVAQIESLPNFTQAEKFCIISGRNKVASEFGTDSIIDFLAYCINNYKTQFEVLYHRTFADRPTMTSHGKKTEASSSSNFEAERMQEVFGEQSASKNSNESFFSAIDQENVACQGNVDNQTKKQTEDSVSIRTQIRHALSILDQDEDEEEVIKSPKKKKPIHIFDSETEEEIEQEQLDLSSLSITSTSRIQVKACKSSDTLDDETGNYDQETEDDDVSSNAETVIDLSYQTMGLTTTIVQVENNDNTDDGRTENSSDTEVIEVPQSKSGEEYEMYRSPLKPRFVRVTDAMVEAAAASNNSSETQGSIESIIQAGPSTSLAVGRKPSSISNEIKLNLKPRKALCKKIRLNKAIYDPMKSYFDTSDSDVSLTFNHNPQPKKRLDRNYTEDEDVEILRYLVKTSSFDLVGGNTLWQDMEAANVCVGRTFQSMKERFRSNIAKRLEDFYHKGILKKRHYDLLAANLPGAAQVAMARVDKRQSIARQSSLSDVSRVLEDDSGSVLGTRLKFSRSEDMAIIRYMLQQKPEKPFSKNVWTRLEASLELNGISTRSWQSLQERFSLRILGQLHTYGTDLGSCADMINLVESCQARAKIFKRSDCQAKVVISKLKKLYKSQGLEVV